MKNVVARTVLLCTLVSYKGAETEMGRWQGGGGERVRFRYITNPDTTRTSSTMFFLPTVLVLELLWIPIHFGRVGVVCFVFFSPTAMVWSIVARLNCGNAQDV